MQRDMKMKAISRATITPMLHIKLMLRMVLIGKKADGEEMMTPMLDGVSFIIIH